MTGFDKAFSQVGLAARTFWWVNGTHALLWLTEEYVGAILVATGRLKPSPQHNIISFLKKTTAWTQEVEQRMEQLPNTVSRIPRKTIRHDRSL